MVEQNQNMLRIRDAKKLVKDNADMYSACIANQYHMPEFKSPICTGPFMREVQKQTTYCPKKTEISHHTCAKPPKRETVQNELISSILQNLHLIDNDDKKRAVIRLREYLLARKADREWLLDMLFFFSRTQHRFFAKNYRPTEERMPRIQDIEFEDEQRFFQGLAESESHAKRSNINQQAPDQVRQLQLDQLISKQQRIQTMIQKLNQPRDGPVRGGIRNPEPLENFIQLNMQQRQEQNQRNDQIPLQQAQLNGQLFQMPQQQHQELQQQQQQIMPHVQQFVQEALQDHQLLMNDHNNNIQERHDQVYEAGIGSPMNDNQQFQHEDSENDVIEEPQENLVNQQNPQIIGQAVVQQAAAQNNNRHRPRPQRQAAINARNNLGLPQIQ